MNNPNPFVPQGSLLEQKNKKRARVKVAVFAIFALNILVITPLLIQGCSKKDTSGDTGTPSGTALVDTNTPDTNTAPPLPALPGSNALVNAASNTVVPPTPPPVPPPAPPEPPATHEYVVVKGDSYYSIAKKLGVKMKELENANPNIPATKMKVGQKLQVPAGASSSSSTGATGAPMAMSDNGDTSVYVVKSGDSLTKIAKAHGITVKALKAANDMKTDKIKAGQKLKVPAKATTGPASDTTAPLAPAPAPPISTPAAPGTTGH